MDTIMMNKEDREATEFRCHQLEDEIDQALKDMAELAVTIKAEAIRYVMKWALGALDNVALQQMDQALKLGIEGMKQLSNDIKSAAKDLPSSLTEKLDNAAFWSHRNGQLDRAQTTDKLPPWERFISPVDEVVDLVAETMVPVALLLEAAGFKPPEGSQWVRRNLANTRNIWGGWHSPGRGALDEANGEYNRAHNQVLALIRKLNVVRTKLHRDDMERMLEKIRQDGAE